MELGQVVRERDGVVIGWRAWAVVDRPEGARLVSLIYDHVWQPGEVGVARCFAGTHDERCACGFHAAHDPVDALSYLRGRDEPGTLCRVLGEVALSAQVFETEIGWRGACAYPARLYAPDGEIAAALACYGVPVSVPVRSRACASPLSPTSMQTPPGSRPSLETWQASASTRSSVSET